MKKIKGKLKQDTRACESQLGTNIWQPVQQSFYGLLVRSLVGFDGFLLIKFLIAVAIGFGKGFLAFASCVLPEPSSCILQSSFCILHSCRGRERLIKLD